VEDIFSASTSSTSLPLEIVNTHHPIRSIRDTNASQLINLQVEPEWKQSDYPSCYSAFGLQNRTWGTNGYTYSETHPLTLDETIRVGNRQLWRLLSRVKLYFAVIAGASVDLVPLGY
jgi:hypothetical protein